MPLIPKKSIVAALKRIALGAKKLSARLVNKKTLTTFFKRIALEAKKLFARLANKEAIRSTLKRIWAIIPLFKRITKKQLITTTIIALAMVAIYMFLSSQTSFMLLNNMKRIEMTFRSLDSDENRTLSKAEIKNSPASLLKLDKNNNGTLEINELGGPTSPIKGLLRLQMVIRALDSNGDSLIDTAERLRAPQALLLLDDNQNNTIESKESFPSQTYSPSHHRSPVKKRINALLSFKDEMEGSEMPGSDSRIDDSYLLVHENNFRQDIQIANTTYLLATDGTTLHQWHNKHQAPEGTMAVLLPNGLLLRSSTADTWFKMRKLPPGSHGRLELIDWYGQVVWSYEHCNAPYYCLHNDIQAMPNGNILVLSYESKTIEEAIAMGWQKQPDFDGSAVWGESIYEIKPDIKNGSAQIVWEWHSWEHIVQDINPSKPNFNAIADSYGKLDLNYETLGEAEYSKGQLYNLNAIDYNQQLDVIMVSSAIFGELWFIDHSTTSEEASSQSGGNYGKGGNLIYRWGNPAALKTANSRKTMQGRKLYWQQDANWIQSGLLAKGDILIFNSGHFRGPGNTFKPYKSSLSWDTPRYSTLMEIKLPIQNNRLIAGAASDVVWSYNAEDKNDNFFSPFTGSSRRLANGNTLATLSPYKRIIEVTQDGTKVLDFTLPGPGQIYKAFKLPKNYQGLRLKDTSLPENAAASAK